MADSSYSYKSADQLTFTDNGMFQAVLHEPGVCSELVERLLGVKVKKVEYPELEKTIAPSTNSLSNSSRDKSHRIAWQALSRRLHKTPVALRYSS